MAEIDGVPQVDPTEVANGAFLLDVRTPDEWNAGHAPDAVHLPLARLIEDHQDVLPDDGTPIVAICRVGSRSQTAAVALRRAGYDVVNLAGGMQAWANAGKDVVTDDGSPGSIV